MRRIQATNRPPKGGEPRLVRAPCVIQQGRATDMHEVEAGDDEGMRRD